MTNCKDIRQDNVDFLVRIYRGGYRDIEIYDLLIQNLTRSEGENFIKQVVKSAIDDFSEDKLDSAIQLLHRYLERFRITDCDVFFDDLYSLYRSREELKNHMCCLCFCKTSYETDFLYENVKGQQITSRML